MNTLPRSIAHTLRRSRTATGATGATGLTGLTGLTGTPGATGMKYATGAAVAAVALLLVLCPADDVHAQVRASGDPVQLTESGFMNPSWSPDGTRIALSAPRYEGLFVLDTSTGDLVEVTTEAGAGFDYSWSPDGTSLLARVSRYEGVRRYNAVKIFDLTNADGHLLTDYRSSMPATPSWDAAGERVFLYTGEELEIFDVSTAAGKASVERLEVTEGQKGLIEADLSSRSVSALAPFADRDILNLVRSPDGSRLAFEVLGGNLFVMDADGANVVDLGPGNRPSWSPDGEWLVYMITEDDGHVITSSDLVAVRSDGSSRSQITRTSDRLEMNPSWSPDGSRIAYDDILDGAVYAVPVAY